MLKGVLPEGEEDLVGLERLRSTVRITSALIRIVDGQVTRHHEG